MKGYIFIDDKRFQYAKDLLKDKGFSFVEELTSPEELDFLVFPFMGKIDAHLYNDAFFSRLKQDIILFSGINNQLIADICKAKNLEYHAIMNDAAIKIKNAIPTSEGVIAHLVYHRATTIFGSRVLVAGYGVVGSDLAKRLKALGTCVYALVRDSEKASFALRDGISPIYLKELNKASFDVVINTVPGQVFDNDTLEGLGGPMMVEIASPPYGFSMEHAKMLNPDSVLLPGIPGKYAVQFSGGIIGEYIDQKLKAKVE